MSQVLTKIRLQSGQNRGPEGKCWSHKRKPHGQLYWITCRPTGHLEGAAAPLLVRVPLLPHRWLGYQFPGRFPSPGEGEWPSLRGRVFFLVGITFNKKPEWFSCYLTDAWWFSQHSPASCFSRQRDGLRRLATLCAPRHMPPRDAVHTGDTTEHTRGTHAPVCVEHTVTHTRSHAVRLLDLPGKTSDADVLWLSVKGQN